ncbi:SDR family oxidoreductase [Sulfurovum sp. bin170]|nr:SDR family NAD(P)-dependent oxidoreductase [Sulfurovum sp. bin170]NEW61529.1 SDR family oxidoreductase [Sulfurovum sp. bin170]
MQKVLVTGATGSLGEAIVKEFAKQGYFVYIHYNSNEEKAKTILKEIDNCGEILTFDIRDRESVNEKLKEIEVDVLVNNSGITKDNLFFWMTDEEWEDVMDINVNGMFRVTKALLPKLIKKKNCAIINISSVSGIVGNAGQTNYSASKGAIISFTKSLALELGRYKIRVNCVAPGLIESEMTKDLDKSIAKSIPLRRYGDPKEVAHAVYFASTNTYMTAETINISGGMVR